MMVATPDDPRRPRARGFANLAMWSRGVDTDLFRPRTGALDDAWRAPCSSTSAAWRSRRTSTRSCRLDLPGTKVVVGDGPQRGALQRAIPARRSSSGAKHGEELACALRAAPTCSCFPSRTDTFGLVLLEAMACGTPVAAYPVTGPIDVVRTRRSGVLDEDLREAAALAALDTRPRRRAPAARSSIRWQRRDRASSCAISRPERHAAAA